MAFGPPARKTIVPSAIGIVAVPSSLWPPFVRSAAMAMPMATSRAPLTASHARSDAASRRGPGIPNPAAAFAVHGRSGVDRGDAEPLVAGVGEAMRGLGGRDEDVSRCRDEPGVVDLEVGLAGVDDEQLGIRVAMQPRARTGPIGDEEQRDRQATGGTGASHAIEPVEFGPRARARTWQRPLRPQHSPGRADRSRTGFAPCVPSPRPRTAGMPLPRSGRRSVSAPARAGKRWRRSRRPARSSLTGRRPDQTRRRRSRPGRSGSASLTSRERSRRGLDYERYTEQKGDFIERVLRDLNGP